MLLIYYFVKILNEKKGNIMANLKSQKKRINISLKESSRNNTYRSSMRTAIKKAEKALGENKATPEMINQAVKSIDVAASKGVIKKNTAARKKSKLHKKAEVLK